MGKKLSFLLYRLIKFLVRVFYPRIRIIGAEHLPKEAAIYVGNHTQMNGPIACELYFPVERATWCIGEMMHLKEVPGYAFKDFWSQKPRWQQPFFKVLSYLIAPISVCVFNNADTVPVYHDLRIRATIRQSIDKLRSGRSLVIFPEYDSPYNHILYDFQDRFIDLAYRYYKETGEAVAFVPFYLAPALKSMVFGKPIYYQPEEPLSTARERIKTELMEDITRMAEALPLHRVVPYRNIPKKNYPMNRTSEVKTL